MALIVDIGLFILGFIIVYFSVDYLLDELEEYLEEYNISPTVFGFLILGMDLEESLASVFGAIENLPLLSIGNLIGNTIIAIAIAFAIPILLLSFQPEPIPKFYYQLLTIAAVNLFVSLLFANYVFIFGIIGIILFGTVVYLSIQYQKSYDNNSGSSVTEGDEGNDSQYRSDFIRQSAMVVVLIAIVIVGGELLVRSAGRIIVDTGINESFFGLVIMAFVTNVEEFWLMLNAIKKDQVELGISAQIGKIFWNISIIFGISALLIGGYSIDVAMLISGFLFIVIVGILVISLYGQRLERLTAGAFLFILGLFFAVNIGLLFV